MIKKLQIILILLVLAIPVSAQEIQPGGSIRLTMTCESEPVTGGSVTMYILPEQTETEDLDKLVREATETRYRKVTQNVDSNGVVLFADLEPGNYLLVQEEAAAGYYPMKSFRVSLPMYVGGNAVYDITAAPKLQRLPIHKLPQTGMLLWPAWILLGLGTAVVGIGIIIGKREQ